MDVVLDTIDVMRKAEQRRDQLHAIRREFESVEDRMETITKMADGVFPADGVWLEECVELARRVSRTRSTVRGARKAVDGATGVSRRVGCRVVGRVELMEQGGRAREGADEGTGVRLAREVVELESTSDECSEEGDEEGDEDWVDSQEEDNEIEMSECGCGDSVQ